MNNNFLSLFFTRIENIMTLHDMTIKYCENEIDSNVNIEYLLFISSIYRTFSIYNNLGSTYE